MDKVYINYYLSQVGGGLNDIGPIYGSPRIYQQGRGVGSFLGGIFKYLRPLIYSGLNAIKKQTIKTGTNVLNDLGKKPFKDIIKERGMQAMDELKEKGLKKLHKMTEQSGNGTSYSFPFNSADHNPLSYRNLGKNDQLLPERKRKRLTRKNNKKSKKTDRYNIKRRKKYEDIFDAY